MEKEPHRGSETDTQQLLLKSNQLVGEVNEIIKSRSYIKPAVFPSYNLIKRYIMKIYIHAFTDISEHQSKKSSSNTPITPAESEVCSSVGRSENREIENFYNKAPEAKLEDISPLMSVTSEEPDTRDEELHHDVLSSEDENKEEDEVEEDDYEEFEETLIEPRPLNEVTSATDRTSPWTTVLSDPELGSLESLEATEQPVDLIHQKGRETSMSPPVTTSELQRTASDSDLSAETESCENTGDVHNVCVEHGDDEVVFNNDSKQDTVQITDHEQHDRTSDTEDSDSLLSSNSGSSTKANSEGEKVESNVKLYPFDLQYCL